MAEEEPAAEELRRPTMAIVSAGESEQSDDEAMHEEPSESEVKPDDLLYGENLDAEDEAWVYKHMRGGVEETVTLRQTKLRHSDSAQLLLQAKLLKPRTSDAVLSCPCCFAIVCMDCQQHERYQNQFRAMFVMNIGVEWNHELIYSQKTKTLIDKPPTPAHHVPLEHHQDQVYYSVHCSTCRTQVAALDMGDEVYHFFACLASA